MKNEGLIVCYTIVINAHGDDEHSDLFFHDKEMAEFVAGKMMDLIKKSDAEPEDFKVNIKEEVFFEKPRYLKIHKSIPHWIISFIFSVAGGFLLKSINNKFKDN